MTSNHIYELAVENCKARLGRMWSDPLTSDAARGQAIAAECLNLLALQDEAVSAERVRELLLDCHERITRAW